MPSGSDLTVNEAALLRTLCRELDLDSTVFEDSCTLEGPARTWRGPLDVNALASMTVLLSTFLTREVWRLRGGPAPPITVDREHAALAFLTEGLATPQGWELPGSWDAIAGDYRCRDGWIRLHTNYPHHRQAALRALALPRDAARAQVAERVAALPGQMLEDRIVAMQGIAGLQRTHERWQTHSQAEAVSQAPLIDIDSKPASATSKPAQLHAGADLPFTGVRVVDLTRVLAGPVASGLLAAWGADVLRIDPPGFNEVAGLVPITLAGKRSVRLDLKTASGIARLRALLAHADILIHGYRDSALTNLGLTATVLQQIQPDLINVRLNAYGHAGPWRDRRGFDSIVQQSIGITHIGQSAFNANKPVPLPCQALDYGTGWLMAACAAHGLMHRHEQRRVNAYALSLARTGHALIQLPARIDHQREQPGADVIKRHLTNAATFSGPLTRIAWPGKIGATPPQMAFAPAIGSGEARWVV